MKKLTAVICAFAMLVTSFGMVGLAAYADDTNEAATAAQAGETREEVNTGVLDTLIFGDAESEAAHSFTESMTVAGVDDTKEAQYTAEDGHYAGGGIGDGLTYRYIRRADGENQGIMDFVMKADPTRQNYITVRLNGTQDNRGNLMLYGPNGDNSVLNARTGRVDSELDPCYFGDYPFGGRYYYVTYSIPQAMISGDGTVHLSIMSSGRFDSYGAGVYREATEDSKFIYSATLSTNPYYYSTDDYTGEIPEVTVKTDDPDGAYEYLQNEVYDMTKLMMSWQFYGDEWEAAKTDVNAFLDGACPVYSPLEESLEFDGATSDEWAREFTQAAINHQNWSTMSALSVYANAYMFDFSEDLYRNPEILDRYIKLLDFFARAQEKNGGWCYYTSGEDAGKWLGASLDGDGTRLEGERWPLLSLGVDAMMQSFIQLNDYIVNGDDEEAKAAYAAYLDEVIDGDLTGRMDKTRREYYIEMFAKLRDYLAYPPKNDFYNPASRAGTANQDFGFAYDANRVVGILTEGADVEVAEEYQYDDPQVYLEQMMYKFGEMVDGQKWFSTENALGLEGGASHGGWAGDYGTLLIRITNKYAESAKYGDEDVKAMFDELSNKAYESAGYFYYPDVNAAGEPVLNSEVFSSPRNYGVGQDIAYPVAGYTASELGNNAAKRFLSLYVEHNRGFYETLRSDIESRTPHMFTILDDAQEYLKYYKEIQADLEDGLEPEEYLPMEDEHPDFAWYDLDGQTVVFKNDGDKCYITFNYRREDWEYNDNTRIHMIEDDLVSRYADVQGSHQGGVYTYEDTTPVGETYTHTRYDGMSQVKYGKYIAAINQSTDDPEIGQEGKTYTMDTVGVKRAVDLVSGTEYVGQNGEDIRVDVAPRTGVVLEVLETEPVYEVSAKYVVGDTILGYENVSAELGESVTMEAESFDGYELISEPSQSVVVTDDNAANTLTFEYAANSAPEFTEKITDPAAPAEFKVTNYQGAAGDVVYDENGEISAIYSTGIPDQNILVKTFAYQEVTDDVDVEVRLDHFDRTATDQDYFSVIIASSPDLDAGSYVELRHFTNNNNILLVSHTPGQGNSATGYWAGDMNNKSVPIWFRLHKDGSTISYEFSLDDGATYEQTSKPSIEFDLGDTVYVGVAMTASSGELNTAYISDLSITGSVVGAPAALGETQTVNLGVADAEGDELDFELIEAPEGATLDENNILTFTPNDSDSYTIKASVNDAYHTDPITKTVIINAGTLPDVKINGEIIACDVSPAIRDDLVFVPLRAIAEKLGLEVSWNEGTSTASAVGDSVSIDVQIGADAAAVNGETVEMDGAAFEKNGRTMVPIRFMSENIGASVVWNDETKTVEVTK